MLYLNEESFRDTAEAVHIMNDRIRDRWPTAEDVYHFMVNCAYGYMEKSASFGTAGFDLTAFDSRGKRHVRASVTAYTARKYFEDQAEDYAQAAAAAGQLDLLEGPDPDDRRSYPDRGEQHLY